MRDLSVRDVEAALAEALGPEATVSRSTVSRICYAIRSEFDAFKHRDLSGIELEYLFVDGSHFKMHPSESPDAWAGSCAGWQSGAFARRCW